MNVPLGDKAAFRLTGADLSRDGYIIGQNGQDKGDLDVTAVRAQFRLQPTDDLLQQRVRGPDLSTVTEVIDSEATGLFGQISFDVTEQLGITLGYRSTEDTKGAGAVIFNDPQVAAEFGTNPLVISAR